LAPKRIVAADNAQPLREANVSVFLSPHAVNSLLDQLDNGRSGRDVIVGLR
jgi:hypothetical protein